jgi:hypothetical protein
MRIVRIAVDMYYPTLMGESFELLKITQGDEKEDENAPGQPAKNFPAVPSAMIYPQSSAHSFQKEPTMRKISLLHSVAGAALFAVINLMKTHRSKIIFTRLAFGVWLPALTSQAARTVTNTGAESRAYHRLFLKSDGSLWTIGWNYFGQLGDGFTNETSSFPEQIIPWPQPILTSSVSSKTNLQINATTLFGGTFYLRASTNLAVTLSQWQPLRTNFITARGANNFPVTVTNAVKSRGQQFYLLQSP